MNQIGIPNLDKKLEADIEILLLTEGIITETESLTGSVKNIIIITRM